jgi:hypothetical protein
MKEKLREQFEVLKGFLTNIKSIANHPYASGVDVNKLVDDLTDFVNDLGKILDEDDEEKVEVAEDEKAE